MAGLRDESYGTVAVMRAQQVQFKETAYPPRASRRVIHQRFGMPCVEHVLHGQLCLRALVLGQLLLLDDLCLFDPDLVCDQFTLAGRIAAEPYAQLRFFELQPDGSQRIARPGTQRHFAVLSPETVAVAEVNTDALLPGVHLAGQAAAVVHDVTVIGCAELQEPTFGDGLRRFFPQQYSPQDTCGVLILRTTEDCVPTTKLLNSNRMDVCGPCAPRDEIIHRFCSQICA
jgi:hypothetical protein